MVIEPDDMGQGEARVEVARQVARLQAAFPHAQVTKATVAVYVDSLLDVPPDVLDVAVGQMIAECEFLPTVARVRNAALSLASVGGLRLTPFEAWGQVVDAIRRVGYYRTPSFTCPLVARATEIMGWQELCSSENQVADRAHFVKVYEQLVEREQAGARLLPASREMVMQLATAADMNRLPPAPPEVKPTVKAVPPTPEFLDALKAFADTKAMPAASEMEH